MIHGKSDHLIVLGGRESVRRVSGEEECLKKPGVLTSPVPTSVSRLQQWSNARKGAVNRASLDKAVQSKIVSRRIVRVRGAW